MVKKEITINNISGWEAKLAAMFIQKASITNQLCGLKKEKGKPMQKVFWEFCRWNRKRQ